MKNLLLLISFLFLVILQINIHSQSNGKIFGKVIDASTGEAIIGANVFIEGTSLGNATDIQGQFTIKAVKNGTYNLIISYISYTKKTISGVIVEDGKDVELNITLQPEAIETKEVVVVGELSLQYESALLNQRKKSTTISDGISAEQIKKSTDNTTAETLRRVPGVTLLDNKYIFVRGVSERYSSALLNNAPLASSEPDKKDFAFDLIPSNLIENTIVEKSYTPDNSGDFAGGVVKVNTIEFPTKTIFSFNYSTGYVNDVSTKNFKSYEGSKTDFLGLDDGKRDLPDGFPDPFTYRSYQNFDTTTANRRYWSSKLNDDWKTKNEKAFLDQSFGLTYGDRFNVFENDLGIITALTYKTGFSTKEIITKDIANRDDGTYFFDYEGAKNIRNVYWGGILNLSYKLGEHHKVGFKNTFTVNSDDEVSRLQGFKYDYYDERITTALRFISRNLYAGQFTGSSFIPELGNFQVNWGASYSLSYRDEPDYRRYVYTRSIADSNSTVPYKAYLPTNPDLYGGGRYYSYQNEHKRGLDLNIEQTIGPVKFKYGANHITSNRSFNARLLSVTDAVGGSASGLIGLYAIDSLYSVENFQKGLIEMKEYFDPNNIYTSSDNLISYFFMTELPFQFLDQNFSFIGGARVENYVLKLKTLSSVGTGMQPINIDNFNSDVLPSFGLIYRLNDQTNLRFSFSRTINRAQFREIAPFQYYNFEDQSITRGNPELKQANISNYDIRFETFPQPGSLISFSLFLKELRNPIERVFVIGTGQNDRTFANSGFARNAGIELEYRTSFGEFWDILSDLMFTANYSRIWSEIEETNIGLSRTLRPMQGQSPYVINLSLSYQNIPLSFSANVAYNRFGKRITETANFAGDDNYEMPRDVIDLVMTKGIGEHLEFKLTVKDLLEQPYENYEDEILVRRYTTNTKLSLGVSYRL